MASLVAWMAVLRAECSQGYRLGLRSLACLHSSFSLHTYLQPTPLSYCPS